MELGFLQVSFDEQSVCFFDVKKACTQTKYKKPNTTGSAFAFYFGLIFHRVAHLGGAIDVVTHYFSHATSVRSAL